MPPLRQAEAERSAALHRLVVERDALDAEERRAREEAQRLRGRIAQSEQDLAREQALDADAQAALEQLAQETTGLEAKSARADEELNAAQDRAAETGRHSRRTRPRTGTADRRTGRMERAEKQP